MKNIQIRQKRKLKRQNQKHIALKKGGGELFFQKEGTEINLAAIRPETWAVLTFKK